jgi:hypothetical protein
MQHVVRKLVVLFAVASGCSTTTATDHLPVAGAPPTSAAVSATALLLELKYFPKSIRAQEYEVRITSDRMVVFTGVRNTKAQGPHSFRISDETYAALERLLKTSAPTKSSSRPTHYGYFADLTTRRDGKTRTVFIDADVDLKQFFVFKKAFEEMLELRAYRCPYYLSSVQPEVEVCALNDPLEEGSGPILTYARYAGGVMQPYEVRVFADRSAVYEGKANTRVLGKREFALTDRQYEQLMKAFRDADFDSMATAHGAEIVGQRNLSVTARPVTSKTAKTVTAASFPLGWNKGSTRLKSFNVLLDPKSYFLSMRRLESFLESSQLRCPYIVYSQDLPKGRLG